MTSQKTQFSKLYSDNYITPTNLTTAQPLNNLASSQKIIPSSPNNTLANSISITSIQVSVNTTQVSLSLQATNSLQDTSSSKSVIPTVSLNTHKSVGLFFGDSNTVGYGVGTNQRWSDLVAKGMNLSEDNQGVSGTLLQNTNAAKQPYSQDGYDSYQSRIVQRHPDDVFIMYGLNDMRWNGGSTASVFQTELAQIVDNLIKDGIPHDHIYLGNIPYINPDKYVDGGDWNAGSAAKHAEYNSAVLGVAKKYHTHFADVYDYMLDHGANSLLQADGFHMNAFGHSAISTAFLNATLL